MSDLSSKHCEPCRGGTPPLASEAIAELRTQLADGWDVIEDHHLTKTWTFKNFAMALRFVNAIGTISESEGHHPEIQLGWGRVRADIWTHKVDGLTLSDFVLAAHFDEAA